MGSIMNMLGLGGGQTAAPVTDEPDTTGIPIPQSKPPTDGYGNPTTSGGAEDFNNPTAGGGMSPFQKLQFAQNAFRGLGSGSGQQPGGQLVQKHDLFAPTVSSQTKQIDPAALQRILATIAQGDYKSILGGK